MSSKYEEYRNYITEHINNVKKAFDTYGELLCEELELEITAMQYQIDNHDNSKWSAEEFEPYARKFFPEGKRIISDYDFNKAWMHHTQYNCHHPEHWLFYDYNTKKITIYDMPDKYIAEMICDWIAMGYKFNNKAYEYYEKKGHNKPLSSITRFKVEYLLNKIKQFDLDNNIL